MLEQDGVAAESRVENPDMQAALQSGRFELVRALRIAMQIASALGRAHELGVIHRDLKPENVLLVPRGGTEFAKLTDFGIAKIVDTAEAGPALTRAGFVCGTPEYMSPEQAKGAPLDARSDLYSVGVLLFQLVTRRLPFEADTAVGFATKHLTEPPPPPTREVAGDEALAFGRREARALHTPGHTPGSLCFFLEHVGETPIEVRQVHAGPFPPARDAQAMAEAARSAFDKWGDTALSLRTWTFRNDDPRFVPISRLNQVRRDLALALEQALANGAKVDGRANDRATPLMVAALGNQTAIVEVLLGKGADVMARNSGGFTPLHAAANAGSVPIAKLLLEKGAALEDAENKAGVTPMMVAGERNHVELAEFFLAQGANVGHPEIHGYLPITRALWKGNKDIVRLYKSHGAACPSVQILGSEDWYRQCMEIAQ